jgi:hypothetical protein
LLWRQRSKEMRKRRSWRVTKPFRQLARLFARKPAR